MMLETAEQETAGFVSLCDVEYDTLYALLEELKRAHDGAPNFNVYCPESTLQCLYGARDDLT